MEAVALAHLSAAVGTAAAGQIVAGLVGRGRGQVLAELEMAEVSGRVTACCLDVSHPTWLVVRGDTRGCPWCRAVELEQQLRAVETVAALAVEYRVPVGFGAEWLWVRREPTGDRWAVLAGRRSAGGRMAWVGGRWQAQAVVGPVGLWEYESATAALDVAEALAERMATGGAA